MKEIKIKPAAPIYLAGLVWVIYAVFLPLYRPTDILIMACLSAAAYFISSLFFGGGTALIQDDSIFKKTGDSGKDALLSAGKGHLARLEQLKNEISDGKMRSDIENLNSRGRKIYDFVSKNNIDARQIKNFTEYYFPTAIKLAEEYAGLERSSRDGAGKNAADIKNKIESVTGSMISAFDKQLDNLYEDKALDIRTDIEVLKNIMKAEGIEIEGGGGGEK